VVVPSSARPDEVRAAALAEERIAALTDGGAPRKVIVVPGRLVNVVL
jgi:leucyl-tRNA synthetase